MKSNAAKLEDALTTGFQTQLGDLLGISKDKRRIGCEEEME
jgi:hypothetical protein